MENVEREYFTQPENDAELCKCLKRFSTKTGNIANRVAFAGLEIPSDLTAPTGVRFVFANFVLTPHHIAVYYETPMERCDAWQGCPQGKGCPYYSPHTKEYHAKFNHNGYCRYVNRAVKCKPEN